MRIVVGLIAFLGLLMIPSASAKVLTKVVAIGEGGVAVDVRGLGWEALRTTPGEAPVGSYVLLYPLMERGLPAQPGRFYPASRTACYSWNRATRGDCWVVSDDLSAALEGLPRLEDAPTILTSIVVGGRRGRIESNAAVAIELALARPALSRRFGRLPSNCLTLRARWTGADVAHRPTRLWSCGKGLWAAGRLYPIPSLASL